MMLVMQNLRKTNRYACVLIALVLFVAASLASFAPDTAHAASKKKTMYVVTKVKISYPSGGESDFDTFSYTRNGLIKTVKVEGGFVGSATYSYDSKNRFKKGKFNGANINPYSVTYKHDKKGRVKVSRISGKDYKIVYNAKGLVTKQGWLRYSYDKKNRHVKTYDSDRNYTYAYAYDKKNQIKQETRSYKLDGKMVKEVCVFKNTYKNNRLIKRVEKRDGEVSRTFTYTYKRVSVPVSLVPQVKAQQKYVLGDRLASSPPLIALYK